MQGHTNIKMWQLALGVGDFEVLVQQIRVHASGGLSVAEIDTLVGEAESNSAADKRRRDSAEIANKADGLVYSTERTLEEYAQHVSDEDRQSLAAALEKTKAMLAAKDWDSLAIAVDELSALSYQLTERLYATLGSKSESSARSPQAVRRAVPGE